MKKFNLFKKIGISALSLIIAGSIGGACFTSTNANASYDYSVTPKSDEYVAGIFDKSDNVSVKAGYNAPDYMNIEAKYSNGVLLDFKSGGSISTTKTYTVKELAQGITFNTIVDRPELVQKTASINELLVSFYQEGTDNAVNLKVNYYGTSWVESAFSGASAYAKSANGEQIPGGYTISTSTTVPDSVKGKIYMRGNTNAGRIFYGMAGKKESYTEVEKEKGNYVLEDGKYVEKEKGNYVRNWNTPFKFGYAEYDTELVDEDADASTPLTEKEVDKQVVVLTNGFVGEEGVKLDNVLGITQLKGYEDVDLNDMAVLRYLNSKQYQYNVGGDAIYDDTLFNGFSADAKIKVKIEALSGTGKILISNLCGEDLSSAIRVPQPYNAYVGYDYKIPNAKLYVNNPKGEDFSAKVIVKDDKGNVVSGEQKINEFTYNFSKEGEYVITYLYEREVSGKKEQYSSNCVITALSQNATKVELKRTSIPTALEKVVGMTYDAGAISTSTIYAKDDLSHVELEVHKPSGEVESRKPISSSYPYTFDESGLYTFKYYAIDDVFTAKDSDSDFDEENNGPYTREMVVQIFVERTYYALETNEYTIFAMGDELNNLVVDKDIISFFDNAFGRNFYNNLDAKIDCIFEVKEPDATEYRSLTEEELNNGYKFKEDKFSVEYNFRYKLSYEVDSVKYTIPTANEKEGGKEWVEFTVYVIDGIQPTIFKSSSDYLYGATFVSSDGQLHNYRATKGSTVTFTKFNAFDTVGVKPGFISDKITVSLVKDGEKVTTDSNFLNNTDIFDYTFAENGEYIFKFDVSDGYNTNYICITIEVKDAFYKINPDFALDKEYSTANVIKLDTFQIVDGNGAIASNLSKKFEVYFGGEKVFEGETLNYNPTKAGAYTVKMLAIAGGNVADEISYNFNVVDKTAPKLTVGGTIIRQAKVGNEIEVATISAVDNNDNDLDLVKEIEITLNGSSINMFNGKFKPVESGVYVVKLMTTDLSGNTATYIYEIDVTGSEEKGVKILGVDLITIILGGVGLVLVAVAVILLISVLRKKKTAKSEDDAIEVENVEVEDSSTDNE